jgi:tripartite-type tricarboxylate transporter receptor subunit TctC
MNMWLRACIAIAGCALLSTLTHAQVRDFPNRPIRMVVPSAPSGTLDLVARVLGPSMAESMGQAVVIDNRPGAATNIGMGIAAQAPGDGYTLLVVSNGLTVNPGLYPNLPFDVQKDLAPVSLILANLPYVLIVHPALPARSVNELVALAKAKPGVLTYSSGGYGTNIYVMSELFKSLSGSNVLHVPYKSVGQTLTAVLSREADMTFFALAAAMPQVSAGKLRALAISGSKRSALLPGVPTVAEAGVAGYEFTSWVGILAPGTTPASTIAVLNNHIVKAVGTSGLAERFASEGADILASPPDKFAAHIKTELVRWSKLIKEVGLRAE